ncbi:MAG TPA: glycosyltransferase family 39 protein [Planctomycetaceae bacterium]|nr:glycosyltransferase family 39 protein [Planctomycetaceae bacterium]
MTRQSEHHKLERSQSHLHRSKFWSILLLALLLRVVAAVAIDQHVQSAGRTFLIEGDANGYWELGQHIAAGEDYAIHQPPRYVLRTPGFPLLLAASIKVFGNSIFAATLVMAVVGTGCCWLTWCLARRLYDDTTALWAMLMVAVSPLQIGSNVQILSETFFSFGLLVCLLALARLLRQEPTASCGRIAFANGILTGLTTLIRPGWLLWTGLSSLLVLLFGQMKFSRKILCAAMICAGCFVALLPWAWRNHDVTGRWVFTSLWSGPSLYDGLHEGATGASDMQFVDDERVYATMSEFDANAHYKQRAIDFAKTHPRRTIELAFLKAGRYLSPALNAAGFSSTPVWVICAGWYSVFLMLILAGIIQDRRNLATVGLLAGPFLQFLLVHMVFVGSIRYRLPVEFPLSILAANGFVMLRQRWNQRSRLGCEQQPDAT